MDLSGFFQQYHSIKSYVINHDPAPERERLQSPQERARFDGLYECILCACCTGFCPSYWWNTIITRRITLSDSTDDGQALYCAALELLERAHQSKPIRLTGVSVQSLDEEGPGHWAMRKTGSAA